MHKEHAHKGREHGHGIEHHESHHEHPMAEHHHEHHSEGHKAHHHKRARGGKVGNEPLKGVKEYADEEAPEKVYAGKGSNVEKEAEEKKHGGRAKRHEGGKVEGKHAHMHLGRPGRKKGGRVGSDKSPLSSAAHVTEAGAHDADSGC